MSQHCRFDASRSLTALEQDSSINAVIEMSHTGPEQQWLTIRQRVTASTSDLEGMTHTQLKAWATANEMEHKTAFTRFKKALVANGINYDRLSEERSLRHMRQTRQSRLARPSLRNRPLLIMGEISAEGGMARLQSQRDSRPLCDQAHPKGRRGMALQPQRSPARQGRRRTCSRSRGPRHQIRRRPHRRTYRWRQKSGR